MSLNLSLLVLISVVILATGIYSLKRTIDQNSQQKKRLEEIQRKLAEKEAKDSTD